MARPVSWLPRLAEIRHTVEHSVRSHYERKDIQGLFELQPRAAARLMEILPSTTVGTSRLVEREALARFLARVKDADNLQALMQQVESEKVGESRRKLRHLVQRDVERMTLAEKPGNLFFTQGRVEVDFETVEELAQGMLHLALILESDGDEFARRFERRPEPEPVDNGRADLEAMWAELEEEEKRARD